MTWKKGLLYSLLPFFVFVSVYLTIGLLLKSGGNVICPDIRGKTVDEARRLQKNRASPRSKI